ncbi:MAG: pteridine reductase [Gammaproteobacteria bacterium]|jgi:pteridine reductase|nr:pteridine reductase [Gammaproteobacteria bacterium]MBT4245641.1 pteridine reductase [Gammaproteobacteria bacterium]MBT4975341.1 pteridine reductase [Gammaproteobacteria bacterium]MBT5547843.1 pteridine reductase [Gammaproteobacteria bacterium]MBT6634029.1 pteridine reductase [Gammaproteobacteria bacterium]
MKTALITGGAARIGAQIAKTLHKNNFNIIIHCNQSKDKAQLLCDELNLLKEKSAKVLVGNLNNIDSINTIVETIESIDLLVNNASVFYPLSVDESDSENWDNILDVNLKAPFFLSKGLSQKLKSREGSIINIIDIHADRPLKKHSVYNISKAGLKMLTLTLAKELAPSVRVNGVSPGSILWPQEGAEISESDKSIMLERIALKRQGSPQDIADTVLFLANSNYLTGQIINVDGGRTLNQ